MPISAEPASFMIARTSAKSRLIRPGTVMMSLIPATPWRSTSSTTRNASTIEVFFWTTSRRRSLGIVIRVSTLALSSSEAFSATSLRRLPSKLNGLVTTPIVRAPCSLASSATTGAAPEPVPPPRPAVMNTMSESTSASAILSRSSSAARWPIDASPPAPRPRVILSPMRILCGASDWSSAWASVLQAMNSTPIISARIIRFTALLPPPPTPMTRMRAKFSESERRAISALLMCLECGDGRLDRTSRGGRAGPGRPRDRGCRARARSIPTACACLSTGAGRPAVRRRPSAVPARTADAVRSGGVRVGQPARKLRRTWRVALSALGSSSAIDCQVPSASRPASTGTVIDGAASSGSTWSAP